MRLWRGLCGDRGHFLLGDEENATGEKSRTEPHPEKGCVSGSGVVYRANCQSEEQGRCAKDYAAYVYGSLLKEYARKKGDTMDIYADLPSAKPSSDATASSSTPAAPATPASKGSWAHSKFQGMIANRRTVKAVRVFVALHRWLKGAVVQCTSTRLNRLASTFKILAYRVFEEAVSEQRIVHEQQQSMSACSGQE